MELHMRMRKMRIVNGKLVVNSNIRRNVTPYGEHVYGHDGRKKINIRRSFRNKAKKARKQTRKQVRKH